MGDMTKDADAPACHDGHFMHDPGCPYCMGLDLPPFSLAIHEVTGCDVCVLTEGHMCRHPAWVKGSCPLEGRPLLVRLRESEEK